MGADLVREGAGFTSAQIAQLDSPLDPKHVAKRDQSGQKLSYIEGWHAIAEANRVFGFDAWSMEVLEFERIQCEEKAAKSGSGSNWYVGYIAHVRVRVAGVVRTDMGFGSGIDRDLGKAHEGAVKEAVTDAMKRALRTFGNPFGLALYDKSGANVRPPLTDREWYDELDLTDEQKARVKAARGSVAPAVVIAAMRKSGNYDGAEDFTKGVEQVYGTGAQNPTNNLLGDDAPRRASDHADGGVRAVTLVGIDPGLSGGYAILAPSGSTVEALPLPVLKVGTKTRLDVPTLAKELAGCSLLVIEEVSVRPGGSIRDGLTIGRNWGLVVGLAQGLGIRVEVVAPQTWKARVLKGTAKDKMAAVEYCRRRFPEVDLTPGRKTKPHDGIADALCIAEYGMREFL